MRKKERRRQVGGDGLYPHGLLGALERHVRARGSELLRYPAGDRKVLPGQWCGYGRQQSVSCGAGPLSR
jgi:hypothetical protein